MCINLQFIVYTCTEITESSRSQYSSQVCLVLFYYPSKLFKNCALGLKFSRWDFGTQPTYCTFSDYLASQFFFHCMCPYIDTSVIWLNNKMQHEILITFCEFHSWELSVCF